jgi:hypothetical protein
VGGGGPNFLKRVKRDKMDGWNTSDVFILFGGGGTVFQNFLNALKSFHPMRYPHTVNLHKLVKINEYYFE